MSKEERIIIPGEVNLGATIAYKDKNEKREKKDITSQTVIKILVQVLRAEGSEKLEFWSSFCGSKARKSWNFGPAFAGRRPVKGGLNHIRNS